MVWQPDDIPKHVQEAWEEEAEKRGLFNVVDIEEKKKEWEKTKRQKAIKKLLAYADKLPF